MSCSSGRNGSPANFTNLFSIACFGFGDVSPHVQIVLVWSRLLSGHLLGESWPLLTLCSPLQCLFVILVISRFGFEGGIWVLIVRVPIYCLLVAFRKMKTIFLVRRFIISFERFFPSSMVDTMNWFQNSMLK